MVGWLVRGTVYLTRAIEYTVQTGRAISVCLEWLLPLTGLGATESGVDHRVLGSFVIVSMLVLVASWLAIVVPGFRGARVAGAIASTSKPAILSHAETGHKCGKGYHGLRLFLVEVSGEPLVADVMLEGCEGHRIRTVDDLVFLG